MKSTRTLGIALIVSSVVMALLGVFRSEVVDEFNIFWMAFACALIPGVLLLMQKPETATYLARIVVGGVFVVSGLIKLNDTVGFGIKLEEYFDENALGSFWAIFHDYAWVISIFVSGIEVLLGLALLFGAKARLVAFTLLGMTLFFGWLTYFTASCNDAQMAAITAGTPFDAVCVTDCGCFGDALRGSVGRSLTPWESFYKDLSLFFLVIVVLFRSKKISVNTIREDAIILPAAMVIMLAFGGWLFGWLFPAIFLLVSTFVYLIIRAWKGKTKSFEWILAVVLALITYGFGMHTYLHLPIKDYRPYAEGKNIKDQMKDAAELGLEPTIYANVYKMEHAETGEVMTIDSKAYLDQEIWKDQNWKIVYTSPDPIVIQRGYEAPIATFNVMTEDDTDIGEDLINDPNYSFMVVMYDVPKSQKGRKIEKLRSLSAEADAAGLNFYAITSSPYDVYETYRHENQLSFPFYTGDEIFLKTIIRSNPGLLLLKNGTIVRKWHANDLPTFVEVRSNYLN